jgi:Trk K+ transport system NAD-binding subunit
VAIPAEVPNTTAIFIVMRKMRQPLLLLIGIAAVAVIGLTLMPGDPQPDGTSGRLNAFEAFYVFSITATTIGYGEVPHAFSVYQRWWVVSFIYMSVIGWAYTIARLMFLFNDQAFRAARTSQAVRRTISHIRQPFTIIVGYGYIGRTIAQALDGLGRRVVVLDLKADSVERLATDLLRQEVPGVCGDARNPSALGLAGLGQPDCTAVIAVTGDEEVNLQVVMTCSLLRPRLPVIARASGPATTHAMADFAPTAIINPFDEYGNYLILALRRPYAFRLITWLMAGTGTSLPPVQIHPEVTTWLVIADGPFGAEIAADLRREGYAATVVDPAGEVECADVDAVIAGAESDTVNLALAAHVRTTHPRIFLAVRQQSHAHLPLLDAFAPDSVFFPPRLVAQQAVANLITPRLWSFIRELMAADDDAARDLTTRLVKRLGAGSPVATRMWITDTGTPAVARWLARRPLELGALFRSPRDRTQLIAAYPLMLIRGPEIIRLPAETQELRRGDEIVMVGTHTGFADQNGCLFDDSTLFYAATGRDIPTSGVWRLLTRQRWRDAFPPAES